MWVLGSNSAPLEEQPGLFTAEPSLQPFVLFSKSRSGGQYSASISLLFLPFHFSDEARKAPPLLETDMTESVLHRQARNPPILPSLAIERTHDTQDHLFSDSEDSMQVYLREGSIIIPTSSTTSPPFLCPQVDSFSKVKKTTDMVAHAYFPALRRPRAEGLGV